jgi:phospholipase C
VKQDHQLRNIQPMRSFFSARKRGRLPAVSWLTPNNRVSEHPPSLVSAGQSVRDERRQRGHAQPDWDSTAIFLAWDDWGGFYDHVVRRTSTPTASGCACRRS